MVKWRQGKGAPPFPATGLIEYFGPFTEYDEGIKVWSATFSARNAGRFEWIDYEELTPPGDYTKNQV